MPLLWRIIGAAGAIAYSLDRGVTRLLPGPLGRFASTRPLGTFIAIAILLAILARSLVMGLPFAFARSVDLHTLDLQRDEFLATIEGHLAPDYIVTFQDENRDGHLQPTERKTAWKYFLGADDGSAGLVVESTRPPEEMYRGDATVTLTGPLIGAGALDEMELPDNFDSRRIPFPLSSTYRLYEGREFGQAQAAREAVIVLGGLAILLLIGWRTQYLPFRPEPYESTMARAPAPVRPVRAQLSGIVDNGGSLRRVRGAPATVTLQEDAAGRRILGVAPRESDAGWTRFQIPSTEFGEIVNGQTMGALGTRWALRIRARNRVAVLGFETINDRDGIASQIRQ